MSRLSEQVLVRNIELLHEVRGVDLLFSTGGEQSAAQSARLS